MTKTGIKSFVKFTEEQMAMTAEWLARAPYLGWRTWQRGWSTAAGDGRVRKPLVWGGWVRLSTGGHLNWDYHSPGKTTIKYTAISEHAQQYWKIKKKDSEFPKKADFINGTVKILTWAEGPGEAVGEGHEPSGREKWAMKTMSLAKAPRTSALGHSSRYSEKRLGYANKTLCANQKRTFLLCLSRMQRASYLKINTSGKYI